MRRVAWRRPYCHAAAWEFSLVGKRKESSMKDWDELKSACESCTACELHKTRTNCVFGAGSQNARVMFIGEAPGEQEDLRGAPFVGAAGKLLDSFFEAVGITRQEIYIANILKCRPPRNRDPLPAEQEACIEYLYNQIKLIKPKIIVCLGRISAQKLIRPELKITADHGKWYRKGPYLMTAVYHPALLLRDPNRKKEMYLDLLEVKRRLDEVAIEKL